MIDINDIKTSILSGTLVQDKFFQNAEFQKDKRGRLIFFSGGYSVVFPTIVEGKKWAFRCWHTPVKDAKERYSLIGKAIKKSKLPYFCSFDYVEKGILIKGESFPITKMKWVDGLDLKKYIINNFQEKGKIKKLAESFLDLIIDLHYHHIAHGDLQHGNIMVSKDGEIYLVDYDSMYVPEMKSIYTDVITGLVDYQHPSRKSNPLSSYKLDFFSEVIIYTSLLAIAYNPDLVKKYNIEDSESMLFNSKDFENFRDSPVYKELKEINNEEINQCLYILHDYLRIKDLNDLNPIESYLMSIDIDCPQIVPINENFTIKWTSKGIQGLEIKDFGEIPLNGQKELSLSSSKSLSFVLVSKNGFKIEKTLEITVASKSVIEFFQSDKEYTLPGVPVVLNWSIKNAKKVKLNKKIVEANGEEIVTPTSNTKYELSVWDDFGVTKKTLEIKMIPVPIIESIKVPIPEISKSIHIEYITPQFIKNVSLPNLNQIIKIPEVKTDFIKVKLPTIPDLNKSLLFINLPKLPYLSYIERFNKLYIKIIKKIFSRNN